MRFKIGLNNTDRIIIIKGKVLKLTTDFMLRMNRRLMKETGSLDFSKDFVVD